MKAKLRLELIHKQAPYGTEVEERSGELKSSQEKERGKKGNHRNEVEKVEPGICFLKCSPSGTKDIC